MLSIQNIEEFFVIKTSRGSLNFYWCRQLIDNKVFRFLFEEEALAVFKWIIFRNDKLSNPIIFALLAKIRRIIRLNWGLSKLSSRSNLVGSGA